MKGGKIEQVIVVFDPEAFARMRGGANAAAGFLALSLSEAGFRPAAGANRTPVAAMLRIVGVSVRSIRSNPLLLVFVGIAAAAGASSEGFDRLWEAHLLKSFTFPAVGSLAPVVWFGVLNSVGALLGIAAIQGVVRLDTNDDQRIARFLLLLQCGWVASVLVFGLTSSFVVAALAIWCKRIVDSMSEPLFNAWQTRVIPSEVRATVLSALGQGDALIAAGLCPRPRAEPWTLDSGIDALGGYNHADG